MPRKSGHDRVTTGTPTGVNKTVENWELFFYLLLKYAGNVTRACELSKISREAVYARRNANPEFEARFQEVKAQAIEVMEDEATRRAFEGVEEGIYFQGSKIDLKTVYSDGLIQFLLRANKPEKYKDRLSTENTNVNANFTMTDDEQVMSQLASKLNAVLKPKS